MFMCVCVYVYIYMYIYSALNKKKTLLTSKLDLNLKKKVVNCYICSIALHGAEKLDSPESRSEIPAKF
jgi:hypothetical protein